MRSGLVSCLLLGLAACNTAPDGPACDPDNGGLTLPDGFCAWVVADSLGPGRHLTVAENGDIYLMLSRTREDGTGAVALRDVDQDGRADSIVYFNPYAGTGIDLHDGYLYVAPDTAVFRYRRQPGELIPGGEAEPIVVDLPKQGSHAAKSLAFDEAGHLYVNIGAPANACQEQRRTAGSPGLDPCPLLEEHGGVWRFSASAPNQTPADGGMRYATGARNLVALEWSRAFDALYGVQHGRDQLSQLWPDLFTEEQNAELPAEEFFKIDEGDDFGWPYCYYDHLQGKKVLAPEYGGDGTEVGRCADVEDPILAFPGHWAPNDLRFYEATAFPERYHNGAFIAFHGSWNRAPLEQAGYNVVFVPMENGLPSGDWEVFASGFPAAERLASPGDARYRPTGLAVGPDGSLYISDSRQGRIWRVRYTG